MRLIDADALQKLFNEVSSDLLRKPELTKDIEHIIRACLMVTEMISDAPTIEAEPVRHGHWETIRNAYGEIEGFIHAECGRTSNSKDNYCPNCGASMDEVEE